MWRELTQRNSCRENVRLLRVVSKHRCVTLCDYNDKPVWFHELARLPREQLVASLMDAIPEAVFTSKWANSVCVYVHLTGSRHHIYDPCSKKCEGLEGSMSGLIEGSFGFINLFNDRRARRHWGPQQNVQLYNWGSFRRMFRFVWDHCSDVVASLF